MIHKLIILIFLAIFWFAFSGQEGGFFVSAGIFSCLFALFISVRLGLPNKLVHNRNIFKYIIWLLGQVALSGMHVTKLVWARKPELSPQFLRLNSASEKEVFYAMYANSITMTPGTVTLLIDEKNKLLHAHAITTQVADEIKSGVMAKKIEEVVV